MSIAALRAVGNALQVIRQKRGEEVKGAVNVYLLAFFYLFTW